MPDLIARHSFSITEYLSSREVAFCCRLKASGDLQHFTALKENDANWDMGKWPMMVENDHLPFALVEAKKLKCDVKVQ